MERKKSKEGFHHSKAEEEGEPDRSPRSMWRAPQEAFEQGCGGCWEEDSGCSVRSYRDLTAGPAVGEEAQVKRLRLEMDGESRAVEAG